MSGFAKIKRGCCFVRFQPCQDSESRGDRYEEKAYSLRGCKILKPSPAGEGGPAGPDEGQAVLGNPFVGNARQLRPHQSASRTASVSVPRAAFGGCAPTRACGRSPSGKPLELTGAFSLWGRRCPRPRPRTDEGRACGG